MTAKTPAAEKFSGKKPTGTQPKTEPLKRGARVQTTLQLSKRQKLT